MNTLGDWQQSFAWKVQLLYGYSLPVFVFKFGRDLTSPLTTRAQCRRAQQLGHAIRRAQSDLRANGRNARCDIIAHSFGTLLLATLLSDETFDDLLFGHVILTGSIISRSFCWQPLLESGRVEAILNHRAGRDMWVRLAPWFFPHVGESGVYGFKEPGNLGDECSHQFGHSDYFASQHYDSVIRQSWTPFLALKVQVNKQPVTWSPGMRLRLIFGHRYWFGRSMLALTALGALWLGLHTLTVWGDLARKALVIFKP